MNLTDEQNQEINNVALTLGLIAKYDKPHTIKIINHIIQELEKFK